MIGNDFCGRVMRRALLYCLEEFALLSLLDKLCIRADRAVVQRVFFGG